MPAGVPVLIHASQFPETCDRELMTCLTHRRIAPKFHYGSPQQTLAWLALHRACSPAQSDPDCQRIYEECFLFVAAGLPDKPVHLAGLGCGSAEKEARLLRALGAARRRVVRVTLADGSAGLLVGAYQTIQALPGSNDVSAVVLDLATASDLAATLFPEDSAEVARLVTCFGVLPNAEPAVLIPQLHRLLRRGDWLLVSANLVPDNDPQKAMQSILPLYDNALTRDWLMLFLLDCGFERGDGAIHFIVEASAADPGWLQIVALYELQRDRTIAVGNERIAFRAGEKIRLFYSNRYTAPQVCSLLGQHGLSVDRSWITPRNDEGVFACRLGMRSRRLGTDNGF